MLPNAQQKTDLQMTPSSQTQTSIQWSHLSSHWCICLTRSSACRDPSRSSATGPLHNLQPCAPLTSGLPYEGQSYRSHSAPDHSKLPSSAPYAGTSAHHIGIVFFIARNPAARIGIVVAAVVYFHLLYNQSILVANMQMEIPVGMTRS
jgi:hypothetical protein